MRSRCNRWIASSSSTATRSFGRPAAFFSDQVVERGDLDLHATDHLATRALAQAFVLRRAVGPRQEIDRTDRRFEGQNTSASERSPVGDERHVVRYASETGAHVDEHAAEAIEVLLSRLIRDIEVLCERGGTVRHGSDPADDHEIDAPVDEPAQERPWAEVRKPLHVVTR